MKSTGMNALWACLMLFSGVSAYAEAPEGIHAEVTPYLWMAKLSGDMTVKGYDVDLDDQGTEAGGSLLATVQYRRFVLGWQMEYFQPEIENLELGDSGMSGNVDSELLLTQLAVGYQFDGWREGQHITVAAGVRNLHLRNDLEAAGGDKYEQKTNSTDPLLIVWQTFPLFPKNIDGLSLSPAFSIGGGGDSELIFELFPQLRYEIVPHIHVRFGYRTAGYKLKDAAELEDSLDVKLAGFIFGVGGSF